MSGIMTHVGLLQGNVITPAARESYVTLTNVLLLNGTADFLFGSLPQPLIVPGNKLLATGFDVKPMSKHEQTFPMWHRVFIDTLFEKTAVGLDVDVGGGGPPPPLGIFDPTVAFPDLKLRPNITIPDFIVGLGLLPVSLPDLFDVDADFALDFTTKFPTLLLSLPIPKIPWLPPPSLPAIPFPAVPGISLPFDLPSLAAHFFMPPIPAIPTFTLPIPLFGFLLCALIKSIPIIIGLILAKAAEFVQSLTKGPIGPVVFVAMIVIEVISSCLGIELKNALTFLAGFLVYVEKLTLMLVVLLVGMILGQGILTKLVAMAIGLV